VCVCVCVCVCVGDKPVGEFIVSIVEDEVRVAVIGDLVVCGDDVTVGWVE